MATKSAAEVQLEALLFQAKNQEEIALDKVKFAEKELEIKRALYTLASDHTDTIAEALTAVRKIKSHKT
jgi:hypothetical protein